MQMIHAFLRVVSLEKYSRLQLQTYFLCYVTYQKWLDEIREKCKDMEPETKTRLNGCYGDKVATVIALMGKEKQLCIFPEDGGSFSDSKIEQISNRLEMWMDKLVDDSLRKYNVDTWPNLL